MIFSLMLAGCPETDDNKTPPPPQNPNQTNPIYNGFFNFPTGRVDVNGGRLTITNSIASEVLLFEGKVDKDNYIGMVSSLGSVKIRLTE